MAIRDLNIGTMKEHKLESHEIVEKDFGKDDK